MKIALSSLISRVAENVVMITMASSLVECRHIRILLQLISEIAIPITRAARAAFGMFSTMGNAAKMKKPRRQNSPA